jgi:RNA polymerase sigma factor (sigma-70 family)
VDIKSAWEHEGDFIERTIRYRAKRLGGELGLGADDLQDIQQELRMDLWRRLPSFREEKAGLHTFVTRLVGNKVENIREHLQAEKRDLRSVAHSLDEEVEQPDGSTVRRGDFLTDSKVKQSSFRWTLSYEQILDLQIDVRAVLPLLTDEQRILCRLLAGGWSKSDVAKRLGVSRPVVYDRMKELKKRFRKI